MAADLCSILFPVDFSDRCELAARHVKIWAEKLSAVLNTLHVVEPEEFGYSDERDYDVISDLVVRRTADLKYFSDHYLGENVAHHTVVKGDARVQIEFFAKQEKVCCFLVGYIGDCRNDVALLSYKLRRISELFARLNEPRFYSGRRTRIRGTSSRFFSFLFVYDIQKRHLSSECFRERQHPLKNPVILGIQRQVSLKMHSAQNAIDG